VERLNFQKPNDAKEQYQLKISNRFAALENFVHNMDVKRA
jgi:hypothetical protein